MQNKTRFSICYFIAVFFMIILFQRFFLTGHVQDVSYAEFRKLVPEKKIESLLSGICFAFVSLPLYDFCKTKSERET